MIQIQPYTAMEMQLLRRGMLLGEAYDRHGKLIRRTWGKNAATNVGLNYDLGVAYAAVAQQASWYLGLINNSPSPSLSATDTMSSHAGWAELTTYSELVRQTWTPGAVSGQMVTNPVSAAFSITGTVAIYGGFAVSDNTKGGTGGILTATGAFGSVQTMSSGQTFRLTWTATAAGS